MLTMCKKVLSAVHANQTLLCERDSLTQSVTELMLWREQGKGQSLDMWLEGVTETFNKRYMEWKEDHEACQKSEGVLYSPEAECDVAKASSRKKGDQCAAELELLIDAETSEASGNEACATTGRAPSCLVGRTLWRAEELRQRLEATQQEELEGRAQQRRTRRGASFESYPRVGDAVSCHREGKRRTRRRRRTLCRVCPRPYRSTSQCAM